MAREIGRNWNKDRIRVRNKDAESNALSSPPSLPPLLPPPPKPFHSEPNEIRRRKWEESGNAVCEGGICYDAWIRAADLNSSKAFDTSFTESQRLLPSRRVYETIDVDFDRQSFRPGQQVHIAAPMREKNKGDKLKRFMTQVKDKTHGNVPPTPPKFDFPVEARTPNPEYRRVDEYNEDPRLRAELYPLEDEPERKEVQGTYRHGPETIEILPERNIEQDISEVNLVPTQRLKEDRRVEAYPKKTEITAGTGVRNLNTNPHEFGYSVDRRGKEAQKKDPKKTGKEIFEEKQVKKAQAMFDPLEQDRHQQGFADAVVDRNTRPLEDERDTTWDDRTEDRGLKRPTTRTEEARAYGFDNSDRRSSQRRYERRSDFERNPLIDNHGNFEPRATDRNLPLHDYTDRIEHRTTGEIDEFGELVTGRREIPEDDLRGREISGRSTPTDDPRDRIMDKRIQPIIDFRENRDDGRGVAVDDQRRRPMERRSLLIDDLREPAMGRGPEIDRFQERKRYTADELSEQAEGRDQRRSAPLVNSTEIQEPRIDRNSVHLGDISRTRPLERRSEGMRGVTQDRTRMDDTQRVYEVRSFQVEDERTSGRAVYERTPPHNGIKGSGNGAIEKNLGYAEPKGFDDAEKENGKSGHYIQSRPDSLRRRSGGDSGKTAANGARTSPQYEILKEEPGDIPVGRRDSVMLPDLEESEKEFHELVAAGDVAAVRIFLREHPGFNINCVNYQQISALHVAVHEQNEAMVDFLLEQNYLDCSDCALYAIKEGNVRIVEKIMDKLRETSPFLEFAATSHSVDFPDYMTPIILAAQLGNYEIIDFLIKRGHIIPPVHNPYCKCDACKADLQKYDRLKYSTLKLNLYKAISNPMYIFHVTDDPFQRAFDLTQELQDAAKVFPQFKTSYEELWRDLRNFTVELIDFMRRRKYDNISNCTPFVSQPTLSSSSYNKLFVKIYRSIDFYGNVSYVQSCCRNSQEVEIILKKSANNIAGSITFPRLQYAIDLKQKEFVSHPYTQAVLVDAWTGDLLEWKVRSPLMQALAVFPRIPMLPLMAVMCMFLPNHKLVKKWKTPVNKMISSFASYLIFLIILFLESNLDKTNQKRGPPNSGLESVIIIYVIGYIWLNIRLCFRLGPKRFFSTLWHWFDCIMLFLFAMTIIFWIASLADVAANNEIDLPRKYWNSLDPELVAEGFFAAAVIMAYFRLNMFLSLNYHLGPLQVSIGKMTLDIFRFIIIFFIIIIAWCAGLCRFYQPYDGMVQKDAASGSSTTQVSSFVSFSMTLKTFFWAIFGMSPIESADVVIENLPGDTPDTTIINHHEFTEAVGYIAFALFQFLSVVVVLNMLVACMANTFTKVIDNVTVEWVFGRSQIYLSFMAASTLPPPFNLLPTASGIKSTFLWLKLLAKPGNGQRAKCNISHCCYIESETEAYVNTEFPSLMSELAQRYLRLKGESVETHDDVEELKCEMKELLRKMDKIIAIRKYS